MRIRRILRDDSGASLLLALGFLTFMGVFSVSILAFTGVGSVTTTVVAARADQRYAADAGIEYGIANLAADNSRCATSGSYTWPVTVVNGRTTTYGCTWVSGGNALTGSPHLGTYGTIVTSSGGIAAIGSAMPTNVVLHFAGSVHAAGPIVAVGATQTMSIDGNLTTAGACPTANVSITPPGSCAGSATPPPVPAVSIYVPSAAAAAPTTSGSCTTLYPGRYGPGDRKIPKLSAGGQYYFASGVYYLGGTMTLDGTVFGGARATGEAQAATTAAPCRTTDPVTAYSGSGVAFVIGDKGGLEVAGSTTMVELFARVPGGLDANATAGIGIWSGGAASVLAGSGAYAAATGQQTIVSTAGAGAGLVVHGLTLVPDGATDIFVHANPGAGGSPVFLGGLVTSRLQVVVSTDDDNKVMAVSGTGGFRNEPRVVTLTSTATGASGAAPTTITATVRPDGTPVVSAWRWS